MKPPKKPAVIADQRADRHRDAVGDDADDERGARAVEEAREEIAAEEVGAEQEVCRSAAAARLRASARRRAAPSGGKGASSGARDRRGDDDDDDDEAEQRERPAHELPGNHPETGPRPRRDRRLRRRNQRHSIPHSGSAACTPRDGPANTPTRRIFARQFVRAGGHRMGRAPSAGATSEQGGRDAGTSVIGVDQVYGPGTMRWRSARGNGRASVRALSFSGYGPVRVPIVPEPLSTHQLSSPRKRGPSNHGRPRTWHLRRHRHVCSIAAK